MAGPVMWTSIGDQGVVEPDRQSMAMLKRCPTARTRPPRRPDDSTARASVMKSLPGDHRQCERIRPAMLARFNGLAPSMAATMHSASGEPTSPRRHERPDGRRVTSLERSDGITEIVGHATSLTSRSSHEAEGLRLVERQANGPDAPAPQVAPISRLLHPASRADDRLAGIDKVCAASADRPSGRLVRGLVVRRCRARAGASLMVTRRTCLGERGLHVVNTCICACRASARCVAVSIQVHQPSRCPAHSRSARCV